MLSSHTILQDRYRIIRPIAEGGMGAVYEATDQRLGASVALKESFFAQDSLLQAFHREAALLATLRHRGLPKVIDHFTEDGRQYLVMELIPGDDLLKILTLHKKPFPLSDVMGWADQLLETLVYLHSQQLPVIHRDIKPSNLKLNERGQIMLLDFGLAKEAALDSGPAGQSVRGYSRNYAPIEQIKGTGTDRRSDLYSAAATIYHLMTGVVPADTLARANALVEGRPDPLAPAHTLNPAIPAPVSEALEQALMLDRNRRPENAQAMRELLRQALSGAVRSSSAVVAPAPIPTDPISPGPAAVPSISAAAGLKIKGRPMVWILGAAALALIGLVAMASYLIGGYRARTAQSLAQPLTQPLTGDGSLPPANRNIAGDPDKPIPLTSRVFYGRGPDANRLYSFVAQPGLLKFTVNNVGGSIYVDPYNSEKKQLQFDEYDSLIGSTSGSSKVDQDLAQMKVDREQTILLRITSNLNQINDLQAFRLRIDGPTKLEEEKAPSPLAPLFADRINPAPLTSDTIYGGRGGKKDAYYVLTAGPGDLTVHLNIVGSAASVNVDFEKYIDHDNLRADLASIRSGEPLKFGEGSKYLSFKDDYGSVDGGFGEVIGEKTLHLELKKQQKLLMYISISNHDLLQAYRVKLGGPIQWAQPPQSAMSPDSNSNIDSLKSQFAARDNPRPLTSGVISGKNPEKESYYSFTAGPGTVNLTLGLETDSGGMKVEFFGPDIKPVNNEPPGLELQPFQYSKVKREETMTLTLSREQTVLMHLTSLHMSGGSRYRVKLDGAVKFQ
jgi:serine/threonine protein kinase